jgi:ketosteroid isomerase-like protein
VTGPGTSELLQRAYDAFNARDVEAPLRLMAEDVVWPDVSDGGVVRGSAAVRAHWQEQFEAIDPRLELLGLESMQDGRIRASVRQIVRSKDGDVVSDEQLSHLYTIRDGRIERMEIGG